MVLSKSILVTLSIVTLGLLNGCKDTSNAVSDAFKSPTGFWTTKDSKLGKIGWRITVNDFKRCVIALDTKVTEEDGQVRIDGSKVTYTYNGKDGEYTANYNSSEKTLTEEQGLHLKFVRADDAKVDEFNNKGCHL